MYIIKIKMINLKKPQIIITHLNAGAQKKIVFGPVKTKCNNYAKSLCEFGLKRSVIIKKNKFKLPAGCSQSGLKPRGTTLSAAEITAL